VLWVGRREALDDFNSWLLALANETSPEFLEYLEWIRPKACCLSQAKGGLYPDKNGDGIRPHAVNEMSMLAFYHELYKKEKKLELLPLLPGRDEGLIMKKNNLVEYALGGDMVGGFAGSGVYDPGSYGQYLGGTPSKHGQNKKFVDFVHILGQGMIKSACFPHFLCGPPLIKSMESTDGSTSSHGGSKRTRRTRRTRRLVGTDITNVNVEELLKTMEQKESSSVKKEANEESKSESGSGSGSKQQSSPQCQTAPYMRCGVHDEVLKE
jgi:hypothetical protein